MTMGKREIIYEQHPVSAERKKELNGRGYQIIDARYAPEGYVHPDAEQVPEVKRSEGLTVEQLKKALTAAGVEFKASADKQELADLLDSADIKEEGEQ